MADDNARQKIKNAEAQEKKRREDVRGRIKNAQRFSQLLALEDLTPEEKVAIEYAQNFEEFSRVLGQRHIEQQHELWEARKDWWAYRNVPPPQEPPPARGQARPGGLGPGASAGLGLAAGAGLGVASILRPEKYEDFKKNSHNYAIKKADEWEKAEKKKPGLSPYKTKQEAYEAAQKYEHDNMALAHEDRAKKWADENNDSALTNALDRKKIQYQVRNKKWTYQDYKDTVKGYAERAGSDWDKDPTRSVGRQQTYDRAEREMHDLFVSSNLSKDQAKKWAASHNDLQLIAAIDRKRIADEQAKSQSFLRRSYRTIRRQPAPLPIASTTWTPSPPNTLPGTLPPNTLSGVGAPNVLRGTQPPVQAPRSPGIRGRAKSFGSNLGHRSRKTASSAISYLTRLIRGSGIAGTILGFASGALTALGTAIAATVGAVLGAFSLVLAPVIFLAAKIIALGFVIAFIGLLVAVIIAGICTIPGVTLLPGMSGVCEGIIDSGDPNIPEPPEGVTITKEGPGRIENGADIEYTIGVTYDPDTATLPLSELKVIDWPQFNHQFISASGNYRMEGDFITWVLSENTHTGTDVYLFTFTLRLRPLDQDFEAINVYYVYSKDGGVSGGGDPDDFESGKDGPASSLDCGVYGGIMDTIKTDWPSMDPNANFGDPACSYSETKFRRYIDQVVASMGDTPINAEFYADIAQCESRSANGYIAKLNSNGVNAGAWGRFQMQPGYTDQDPDPGKPWTHLSSRGDVPWQRQIENAVDYNVNTLAPLNQRFEYWETAKALCGWPKYSSRPYCSDIVANGKAIPAGTSSNDCANALGQE